MKKYSGRDDFTFDAQLAANTCIIRLEIKDLTYKQSS
jgi:hypothetical protein